MRGWHFLFIATERAINNERGPWKAARFPIAEINRTVHVFQLTIFLAG